MKTNSTLIILVRIIAFVLLCLYSLLVFGQTETETVRQATPLNKFTGVVVNDKNVKLQWTLNAGNNASTVTIEKGNNPGSFQAQAEFWVNMEGNFQTEFKWSDEKITKGKSFYRLRIADDKGNISYSNVLQLNKKKGLSFSSPSSESPNYSSR